MKFTYKIINHNDLTQRYYNFISRLFCDFRKKNTYYYGGENYSIDIGDIYDGNMCCNSIFNYYMYYYYNKLHYIKNSAIKYDRYINFSTSKLIELYDHPTDITRNILCVYEKKYNRFTQIINVYDGHYPTVLIKPIDHHKIKRMIIVIKLLSSVISKYIVQILNKNKLVLYHKKK